MAERRLHYAWIVAGVTFVTLLGAAGFRATPGLLINPLGDEFGWSKGTVSIAISVNLVLYGLIGPFAAALMARFGLRVVVIGALITISVGALLTTQMTRPWHMVLTWGVLVGAGSGCMATVLAATVATRWFVARRGLVVGALTAAGATGQLAFLPILARVIEVHGWRTVSVIIAISSLAVVLPVALLLRDKPEDVGTTAYGAPPGWHSPPPTLHPIRTAFRGLDEAKGSLAFWLLFGSFFVCGASTNGLLGAHFIPAAHDHGMTETSAASLLALIGIFDVIGTVAAGLWTDRVDPRRLLLVYYGLRGLSLFELDGALRSSNAPLWAFVLFYGLDWVATVPPTVSLCNEVFGSAKGPVVYGWVFAGHQLGAAAVAWFAGVTRDHTGSYRLAFGVSGVLCLVAAAAASSVQRPTSEPEPELERVPVST